MASFGPLTMSIDETDDAPGDGETGDELSDESSEPSLDLDDDADEAADPRPSSDAPPVRRGSWGAWMAGAGGGLWLLVATMRCSPTLGPDLAVDEPRVPEPAEVEPATQPAIELPEGPTAEPAATKPDGERDAPPDEERQSDIADNVDATPPRTSAAAWARNIEVPEVVTYTIQRGGSMENVANLFKIHHHEIVALNPGVELERELGPKTKLTVYRRERGEQSESVGYASSGSLEGAVPMVQGRGRELKMIPWKSWATGHTVAMLDRVLAQWAERGANQPILVGNMSSRHGGRLEPHSTHQSGRDVDLGYLQKLRPQEEHNWRAMDETNLDCAETWALLFLLAKTGAIEAIFIDRSIQKLLYEHAVAKQLMSKRQLGEWMEYPRGTGSGSPMIQHVDGHIDHLHVRFACRPHESRCQSR